MLLGRFKKPLCSIVLKIYFVCGLVVYASEADEVIVACLKHDMRIHIKFKFKAERSPFTASISPNGLVGFMSYSFCTS